MPLITLPDGTKEEFSEQVNSLEIAKKISSSLAKSAIASKVADLMGNLNEASPSTVKQLSTKSWFSIKKAERILGWKPEVSFEEGMKVTHEWAKRQGLLEK